MQPQIIESGVQLFSRINSSSKNFCLNNINPKLFELGTPNQSEIVEVSGVYSQDLLLDFIARCILPKELNQEWKGSGVIFVNTSHHINILKITSVINAQLKFFNIENRKSIIEKALGNIIMLNCYNYEQVEITFLQLEKLIQDRDNINLLIIDDICSQYYIVKQKNTTKMTFDQFAKQNLQILQKITKNQSILLVFSRYQSTNLKKATDLHVDYKIVEEVGEDFKKFVTMDYIRNTTKTVNFKIETFIKFM